MKPPRRRDDETARRAGADADHGVHHPPEGTPENPSLVQVWQNEQDRRVYERAHSDRREQLDEGGTPYTGDVPPRGERRRSR